MVLDSPAYYKVEKPVESRSSYCNSQQTEKQSKFQDTER